MMQTRDQKRAETAYKLVEAVSHQGDTARQKYGTMALSLPMLVRTAGLLAALEFVNSRKEPSQRLLLDHLKDHLTEAGLVPGGKDVIATCRKADLATYLRLNQEVLAVLLWHKRLTHSLLGVEAGEDE